MERRMELVGVIGGMGPLATVELMRFVIAETPASCDQEHIPMLIYSNPQIPDRTQAILGDGPSPVPALVESARLLERAGATFLASPCNTAHYFLPEVKRAVGIPIIDMIEETAAQVAEAGVTRVGVLATEGTTKCGVYQRALQALGVEAVVPGASLQLAVTKAIYDIKAGSPLEDSRHVLEPVLEWANREVGAVISGCTELSLVLGNPPAGIVVVDAMRVLANRIVRRALGAHACSNGGADGHPGGCGRHRARSAGLARDCTGTGMASDDSSFGSEKRVRLERDLLGPLEVPEDAYYGIQTLRSRENFRITGDRMHPTLITCFAMVKKAAALANMRMGHLRGPVANAIMQAADEVMAGALRDSFVVDAIQGGAGTSMNMNTNEVLANRAIEILGGKKGQYELVHPLAHVNMAQSTNDVFPTAARLAVLYQAGPAIKALNRLVCALGKKSREFRDVVKTGRTHLQDAVPITLGQEFGAYTDAVSRDLKRMAASVDGLLAINMGATAVGTGLNADPEYTAAVVNELGNMSGFELRPAENLVDATQNVDVFADISSSAKMCAITLSKIANDLRLLASGPSAGLKEINLPPVQPGSSMMPGKVNPVIAEALNQAAFQIMGNDTTVVLAAQSGQLELNVFEPVLIYNLLRSIDILTNAVDMFIDKCVTGITANQDRCRAIVENNVGILTALSPYLSYDVASTIAKEALRTGKPVRDLVLQTGLLSQDELSLILTPEQMTRPGIAGAARVRQRLGIPHSRRGQG